MKRRRIALIALWIVLLLGTAVFAGYKYLDIKWKGLTQRDENWNPDDLINLEIFRGKAGADGGLLDHCRVRTGQPETAP